MLRENNKAKKRLPGSNPSCRMVYMMMRNYSVRFTYFGVVLGLIVGATTMNSAVAKVKNRFNGEIEVIQITVEL